MNGYVLSFLLFVVGIVFGLLIFTVLMRLILQIVRADFYNPISQFMLRITNPMLLPLRRIIPGLFGIDMAAVVLLVFLEALEIVVTHLATGDFPFIRYRTGDVGVLSDRDCACGRGLPVLGEIQGRTTDFVVARDGTVMHDPFNGL